MRTRQCPGCNNDIWDHFVLCDRCRTTYGMERTKWPEWLRFLVRDNDRQKKCDQRHDVISLDALEEIESPLLARDPNIEFEEWLWELADL